MSWEDSRSVRKEPMSVECNRRKEWSVGGVSGAGFIDSLVNTGKWSDGDQWVQETAGASEVSEEVMTRSGVCIDTLNASLQFTLSRVWRCNIYYSAVLQLDMKHCWFYSFFVQRCVLSISWITYSSETQHCTCIFRTCVFHPCEMRCFILAFSSTCVFSAPVSSSGT